MLFSEFVPKPTVMWCFCLNGPAISGTFTTDVNVVDAIQNPDQASYPKLPPGYYD